MLLQRLYKEGLIHPPKWLISNTAYLTIVGSESYGASSDDSDKDLFGFCIPHRDDLFPHLRGEIPGFGLQHQRFEQWSEHHVQSKGDGKQYDFSIYSIIKFVQLAMENNPNILETLFTPRRCVIHSTPIAEHLRLHRKLFLHKGGFHKFRGYMFSQMSKIKNKTNSSNPKRAALIESYDYDTKFGMHVVRLALEAEQILVEHDLDLERNREILKSIRRGEWTLDQLDKWATEKERALELVYASSTLRHSPDEEAIKQVLLTALEMHYGKLDNVVGKNPSIDHLLDDLRTIIDQYSNKDNINVSV